MIVVQFWQNVLELALKFSFPPYRPQNIPVYNCTTGGINPFRWGEVGRLSILNFCFDTTDL